MTQTLPLFEDVEDRKAIDPKVTRDDRTFRKERRSRKKKTSLLPAPATGPCCERCKQWSPPQGEDEYGKCAVLAVATMPRLAYGIEKGTVHAWELLEKRGVPGEALRTGPAFQCVAFEEEAA